MTPSPVIERNARRVIALRATARLGGRVGKELAPIIEGLREEIDPELPKAVASRLLGVSVPTLNKWIGRGLIPVVRSGHYERVRRDPLLDLVEQVTMLRHAGRIDGVLAEAVHRLQATDVQYQQESEELYGESLAAMDRAELVPATIPDTFGPDD